MRAGPWSTEELLRTLCAYASLNPEDRARPPKELLVSLRELMPKRTLGSIAMRFSNYVARDPEVRHLNVAGLFGGGSHVDQLWRINSHDDGALDRGKLLLSAVQILGSKMSEPDSSL